MESQPQSPEFRNTSENFHCNYEVEIKKSKMTEDNCKAQ